MAEKKREGFKKMTVGKKPLEVNKVPRGIHDPPPKVIHLHDLIK